jgi:microcompartment protein CcmK/EutM
MKKYIGIWVDHKKAVIVTKKQPERSYEEDAEIAVTQISSDVERKVRLAGGSRTRNTPWGPQEVAVDSKIEARQKQQLKKFYYQIIEFIKDADKILILGPGEAKLELKKEIEKSKALIPKIVGVHTSDKMTNNQIAAKVKSYFGQK